jgi:hypothetical protein
VTVHRLAIAKTESGWAGGKLCGDSDHSKAVQNSAGFPVKEFIEISFAFESGLGKGAS